MYLIWFPYFLITLFFGFLRTFFVVTLGSTKTVLCDSVSKSSMLARLSLVTYQYISMALSWNLVLKPASTLFWSARFSSTVLTSSLASFPSTMSFLPSVVVKANLTNPWLLYPQEIWLMLSFGSKVRFFHSWQSSFDRLLVFLPALTE